MIFCCGAYHEPDLVYFLKSNNFFKNRKLEILKECPGKNENCRAFIAELSQVEINSGRYCVRRFKNNDAKRFVEKILKTNRYEQFKLPCGSKSNMNWVYGENKELRNHKGQIVKIVQRAVDFNNKKKISNISIFLLITFLHSRWKNLLCSFFTYFKILAFAV